MSRPRASEAERVFLRPPTSHDADAFIAGVRASRALHRPWSYPPDTPEAFGSFLERHRHPSEEIFLICRIDDHAIVGYAALGQIHLGHLRGAYLGYAAFAPHDGQGYMTEGIQKVLRHAFASLKLHRVEANVQPANARSIALMERLGFRREGFSPKYLKVGGRWRDHVRYAILAEEFFRDA